MERFRVSGLPKKKALALLIGEGDVDPHMGGQAGSKRLPAVRESFLSELALDGSQEVIRQNRDEQVSLQTVVQAMIHRSETQFALEGAKGFLHIGKLVLKIKVLRFTLMKIYVSINVPDKGFPPAAP
jgi:hypothetical protein